MNGAWRIVPRDPLVFGTGLSPQGVVVEGGALPPPSTVAGMVRSAHVAGHINVDSTLARSLLEIGIRGPWLLGPSSAGHGQPTCWSTAPVDGTWHPGTSAEKFGTFSRLTLMAVDENILWPVPLKYVAVPASDDAANQPKSAAISQFSPVWPLAQIVNWAVGRSVVPSDVTASPPWESDSATVADEVYSKRLASGETRQHVAMDDDTATAAGGALFTTPGTRIADGFSIGLEVEAATPLDSAPLPGLVQLGGEARLSQRVDDPSAAFPPFDHYANAYQPSTRPSGLRLQLLTPAVCQHANPQYGWLPSWINESGECTGLGLEGFKLVAVAIARVVTISGWDMQAVAGRQEGGPRRVRRLVPAGSVYWFEPQPNISPDYPSLCARLWGAALEPRTEANADEHAEHRAPPARDGFGLCLPGLWFDTDKQHLNEGV